MSAMIDISTRFIRKGFSSPKDFQIQRRNCQEAFRESWRFHIPSLCPRIGSCAKSWLTNFSIAIVISRVRAFCETCLQGFWIVLLQCLALLFIAIFLISNPSSTQCILFYVPRKKYRSGVRLLQTYVSLGSQPTQRPQINFVKSIQNIEDIRWVSFSQNDSH